jgi:spore maturation protein A
MVTYIWSGMIIFSVICSMMTGNMQQLSEGILDSAKEAVDLCIYMAGIVGLWSGMMKAAQSIGVLKKAEKVLMPLIRFLFPKLRDTKAIQYIAANMAANILGLGWAATPTGLKAMKRLQELNQYSATASADMCTFLIINISSLQLIPINIIAYRSQYGSVSPTAIVVPAIVATAVSTAAGILFCKLMNQERM